MKRNRRLILFCLTFLLLPRVAAAHDVGSGLAGHRLEVTLTPEEILVEYTLEIPASVWVRGFREAFPEADLLSGTEAWSAFRDRNLAQMERGILCLWNGKETALQRVRGEEQEAGLSSDGFVRYGIRLRGEPPSDGGEATLILINRNQAAIRGVFFASVVLSPALRLTGTNLRDPAQRFLLDSRSGDPWSLWEGMRSLEVRVRPAPPWSSLLGGREPARLDNRSVYQELQDGKPFRPGAGETGSSPDSATGRLKELLRSDNLDPGILLGALLLAFLLGGLHALAPGHGKALVGAYLVGIRGRPRDAVALGLIVTCTHVASVLLLGILSLAASRTFVPERLLPLLEAASALLLVVLGAWMIRSRWPAGQDHTHAHGKGHPHEEGRHHHEDTPDLGEESDHEEPLGCHPAHPRTHAAEGPPGAGPPATVRFREMLSLGISGGMVPCPSALAILLIAIAIQRIAFGIAIIVAFSLGLAAVLTAVGLLLVWGGSYLRPLEGGRRWAAWLPVGSSVLVLLVGLSMLGRVLIHGGLLS